MMTKAELGQTYFVCDCVRVCVCVCVCVNFCHCPVSKSLKQSAGASRKWLQMESNAVASKANDASRNTI